MLPILRTTPALALLLVAAGCGAETTPAPKEAQAASTPRATPSATAAAPATAAPAAAAPTEADAQAAQPAVVAAAGGRPAMLDTGIDLTHLKEDAAPGATAFPPATAATVPTSVGSPQAGVSVPPGKLELVEGEEVTEFGELLEGERASASFRFKSSGENPLIVERVKPSCGCTAAEIEIVGAEGEMRVYELGAPIPGGTEFQLQASVNTANRRGLFASNIAIYTNDPASPLRLQLKADVQPVLEIEPISLDFGTISSGEVKEGVITIRSAVLDPFHLELDRTRILEPLEAELVPIEPDAEGRSRTWELAVKLGPNTAEGMRRYPLRVTTDVPLGADGHGHGHEHEHAEEPPAPGGPMRELTCTVTANVTGLIVPTPNFISLGVVRPGQTMERTVKIESLDPDFQLPEDPAYTFQSLSGGEFGFAEHFRVTTRPVEGSEGRALEMTLRLEGLPEDVPGSFGGMVVLAVGHPTKPEVNVRFSGVARAGIPAESGDNR